MFRRALLSLSLSLLSLSFSFLLFGFAALRPSKGWAGPVSVGAGAFRVQRVHSPTIGRCAARKIVTGRRVTSVSRAKSILYACRLEFIPLPNLAFKPPIRARFPPWIDPGLSATQTVKLSKKELLFAHLFSFTNRSFLKS